LRDQQKNKNTGSSNNSNKNGNKGVMPMAYNQTTGSGTGEKNTSGASGQKGKLPQTGELENSSMTAIGLGALLGASTLFFRKRKEDEEAEER
ncbi:LPXTG cell wall anchor domain-containing protein, partial [Vagococcus sp.]|uniref:LPXTG cell wall anchor domain-containing protein n=1 Tax=Vagococcus sp. TaxID=1933889 RepID=UPI002FC6A203